MAAESDTRQKKRLQESEENLQRNLLSNLRRKLSSPGEEEEAARGHKLNPTVILRECYLSTSSLAVTSRRGRKHRTPPSLQSSTTVILSLIA